jgi:hypothetical protein
MTTQTATVETLTAQVKTLVIGSRQITLSVARQLDVISDKTFEACFRGWAKSLLGPHLDGMDWHALFRFFDGDRALFDERFPMLKHFPVPGPEEIATILGDSFVPFGRINIKIRDVDFIGKDQDGNLVLLKTGGSVGMLVHKAFGGMPLIVLAGLR